MEHRKPTKRFGFPKYCFQTTSVWDFGVLLGYDCG